MRIPVAVFMTVAVTFALSSPGLAQRRGPGRGGGTDTGAPPQMGPQGSLNQAKPKPYEEVITKDAKTQQGMFLVHELNNKIYWEIPKEMLGRVFLWQTEIAQVPDGGFAYPGLAAGTHVVCFERRQNAIYMREPHYNMRTESQGGVAIGVASANVAPILSAFNVETEGKDGSAVVDVTRLFTSDQAPFSVGGMIGSTGVDLARSYIDRVSDFPQNIETRSLLTFQSPAARTAMVHYSLDLLPEKPMQPRYRDDRIGFFGTGFSEYGGPEEKVVSKTYIDRFRLEKKDPDAAVSEPVKPIVFYLAREVPNKYRPWLKKAVEDWNVAFEKAGFKNAIVCKNAPSVEEDPSWDAEDARFSVIRWVPSSTENAMGPHVADPRSGETISAHIIVWHNVLNLAQHWYFSQAAANDPSARRLPFSDQLMGRLMEYVVCHEVGHTLGLEHNFKASSIYSVKQLRTPGFVSQNGVASSIMSYSRFNYVAQPGDHLSQEDMLGRIGPYDKFAIMWGYKPIPGAHNPNEEKTTLDRWAALQVDHPELRFGNYVHPEDPTTQSECIGSDPVLSAEMGLKNIDRTIPYMFAAATKPGESYDDLRDLYATVMGQRVTELYRITRYVGGVVETNYHVGHGAAVFKPVPKADQAAAVKCLTTYGLHVPAALQDRTLLSKIYSTGEVSRMTGRQTGIVSSLLSENTVSKLLDNEAVNGSKAYTVAELARDLQDGVWDEVGQKHPQIDIYRRALQTQYLYTIDGRINGPSATKTDLNGIEREGLRKLARSIDKAIPKAADEATARHLRESRRLIALVVEGKLTVPGSAAPAANPFAFPGLSDGDGCWPEIALPEFKKAG